MAHDQEIMGSNPGTVYWMDFSDASYYIIEKLKMKVAKWGTPKKYLKKEQAGISLTGANQHGFKKEHVFLLLLSLLWIASVADTFSQRSS
jgi:hypothetical protein